MFCFGISRGSSGSITRSTTDRWGLKKDTIQSCLRDVMSRPKRIPYQTDWPIVIEWSLEDVQSATKFFLDQLKVLLGCASPEVRPWALTYAFKIIPLLPKIPSLAFL